jgi:hypothetical protein
MTRKCKKCEVEKKDECFQYGKVMRTECRDCHNKWRREAAKKYKEKAVTLKKTCTDCKAEKPGSDFAYSLLICKACKSQRDKEEKHRATTDDPPKTCTKCEKEQPAPEFRYQSNVCLSCEKARLYEWRKENPDKFKELCKKYRTKPEKKEKRAKYLKDKYTDDMNFRLEHLYRSRVRLFIKGGIKKGNAKYKAMLGCSWDTLRAWLESNFAEGMTWDNYGTVWHVDHAMPCSVFDFTIEENAKVCFNWSNLSPMIGSENISKSNKIDMAFVASIKEKALVFMKSHRKEILADSLPADMRRVYESEVLDTKVTPKGGAGSGEILEVR